MKKWTWLLSIIFLAASTVQAQLHPDSLLIGDRQLPKILLVGTFHFGYPNLDAHKVGEEEQVDILSPERQAEVEELVDYLARFRPTRIAVEAGRNTGYLLRRYERWKAGDSELRRNEIDQLAFRLLDRFGLDTLYGVDAPGLTYSLQRHPDSAVFKPFLMDIYGKVQEQGEHPLQQTFTDFYDYHDELTLNSTLLDYFQYLNSPPMTRRYHGHYLLWGNSEKEGYEAADAITLYWYSRNLRVVQNIMRLEAGPDDRILVLMGAGHKSILKQQFESSIEYELVPFEALKTWRQAP